MLRFLFSSYLVGSTVWRIHNDEEWLPGEREQVTRMKATTQQTHVWWTQDPKVVLVDVHQLNLSPVHFLLGLIPLLDSLSIHHISICICKNSTKIIWSWGNVHHSFKSCFNVYKSMNDEQCACAEHHWLYIIWHVLYWEVGHMHWCRPLINWTQEECLKRLYLHNRSVHRGRRQWLTGRPAEHCSLVVPTKINNNINGIIMINRWVQGPIPLLAR